MKETARSLNLYTMQNRHKWNDMNLEIVDSILDCDRPDIFYNFMHVAIV